MVDRAGLENRCTGKLVPWVRIPPPPLISFLSNLTSVARRTHLLQPVILGFQATTNRQGFLLGGNDAGLADSNLEATVLTMSRPRSIPS